MRRLSFWKYAGGTTLLLSVVFFVIPPPSFSDELSTVLYDRNHQLLSARVAEDEQWRFPVSDSVPYKFACCIKQFEDAYFDYHPGVNPVSMLHAAYLNLKTGKIVSGGSTISMQVVRLSRKGKARTFYEKVIELILALRLEVANSKSIILNLYTSYAPFGGNVVGLEAAAWRYYGRPAHTLSWGESAALAVLPNAPSIIYPGKNQQAYADKRNRLLLKLWKKGIIDSTMYSLSKMESLPSKAFALPDHAPHLLQQMVKRGWKGKIIRSSIDLSLQQHVGMILDRYYDLYRQNQIHNGAIVVVENKTRKVRVYLGNTKCPQADCGSRVDVLTAQRSTGSLLKPFLYALAMDDGRITHRSLLEDIPTRIAGFTPKNFDKKYAGAVPADKALIQSLNVPAVRLLREYGLEKFNDRLQDLHFRSINRGPNHYGLSIILGGAESNALELVGAYSGMANQLNHYFDLNGKYFANEFSPVGLLESKDPDFGEKVNDAAVSTGAIWNVLNTLTDLQRPRLEGDWKMFESSKQIAWKTGTSYGFRDAWAIGVTPEYTVGAWFGNASGEGRPGLIGVETAAPVMFDVFGKLPDTEWFTEPYDDLEKIETCFRSGDLAGPHCDSILEIPHPFNGRHGLRHCVYHRLVHTDANGEFQVNSSCYPLDRMVNTSWFVLPPAMEWYYVQNSPNYHRLPPFSPDCQGQQEEVLEVIYPSENSVVRIPKDLDGQVGRVVFEAAHHYSDCPIYWHVDNDFIKKTTGIHKIEFLPEPGSHELTLLDGQGNRIVMKFSVIE